MAEWTDQQKLMSKLQMGVGVYRTKTSNLYYWRHLGDIPAVDDNPDVDKNAKITPNVFIFP